MFFHFVKKDDNLYELSKLYNVPLNQLIEDNSLLEPEQLVLNQCLLINPSNFNYEVKDNDTLTSISKRFNIPLDKLRQTNNINESLQEGQILNIKYDNDNKTKRWINGYCYNSSSSESIKKVLPYLTSLSIFSYLVSEEGNISSTGDDRILDLLKNSNVSPIMVITNSKEKGGFSPSLAHEILSSKNKQEILINNIIKTMKSKNYLGLNVDFEYINPEDKADYISFLNKIRDTLHENDFFLTVALAPKYSSYQKGLLYEAHDYEKIGQIADLVILMTYEWGYTYGPSMAVAPFDEVLKVINYSKTVIAENKILMGLPNYGYDFIIPYKEKQKARSIKNNQAIPLAYKYKVDVKYSKNSRTPSFIYKNNNISHEVQYDNPYSIDEKLSIVQDNNLKGLSIWTINSCCKYIYLLIENNFEVLKNPNF